MQRDIIEHQYPDTHKNTYTDLFNKINHFIEKKQRSDQKELENCVFNNVIPIKELVKDLFKPVTYIKNIALVNTTLTLLSFSGSVEKPTKANTALGTKETDK